MAVQDAPHTTIATSRKPPAYRRRKGYTQAIVTLTDAVTKRRRDYWLGEYGTPECRELYYRVLAESMRSFALGFLLLVDERSSPLPERMPVCVSW